MRNLIFLPFCLLAIQSFSQVPFTTYSKKKHITKAEFEAMVNKNNAFAEAHNLTNKQFNTEIEFEELYNYRLESADTVSKADYFDHMSANIVIIQDAKKMFPSINGEVINYRLGIWTQKKY